MDRVDDVIVGEAFAVTLALSPPLPRSGISLPVDDCWTAIIGNAVILLERVANSEPHRKGGIETVRLRETGLDLSAIGR